MKNKYATQKDAFKHYLSETKRQVDSELAILVSKLSELNLHPQIEYAVLSEGKRLRPILVILSAQSVGRNKDDLMSLAIAFELMHTATLIHDDIIDQDETRRGRPTLYKKWSNNDAILTGDALVALSIRLASKYGEEIISTAARCALELCDGEHMDANSALKTATEESYFKMIEKKTASLFRDSAYCGALVGGATTSEALSLSKYGENLGMAYQLRDDLLDLETLIESSTNLKPPRISLPLIHLYEKSDLKTRDQLEKDLFAANQFRSRIIAERVERMLLEADSTAYCKRKMSDYMQKSLSSIKPLRESESKSYLIQITDSLVPKRLS